MRKARALANWIRRRREALGVRSALGLARKAGLSINYVSMVERGERLPRWKTAEKLAAALELRGPDRDEFFNLVDQVGKPASAREAAAGVALPGLVLWRHLPYLLYQLPSPAQPFRADFLPDEILFNVVRAAGSTLAWAALCLSPPDEEQRATLRARYLAHESRAIEHLLGEGLVSGDDLPHAAAAIAAECLPHLWRRILFAERRSAARWAGLLRSWQCEPAGLADDHALVALGFRDAEHEEHFGFFLINPDTVCQCHDVLVATRLAVDLELLRDVPRFVAWLDPGLWPLKEYVPVALAATPAEYRSELMPRTARRPREQTARVSIVTALRHAHFALRTLSVPPVAALIFGNLAECDADRIRAKLAELEQVYDEWLCAMRAAPNKPTAPAHVRARARRHPKS
jgi:transcriptional regulator with XRE-family HTH domain